jgi:uncharacterized membrane protein
MGYRIFISIGLIVAFFLLLFLSTGSLQFLTQLFTLVLLTSVLLFFLSSLRANKTPIITRYALLMEAEDSIPERTYTRQVTWLWVIFFFVLCFLKVDSLLVQHQALGIGLIEGLFYMGSVILFVGEFYARQLFLPAHKGASLWRFLTQLTQVSVKDIWQFDANNKDS